MAIFHPEIWLRLWGYRIPVETLFHGTQQENDFVEVTLGLPETLHQQLQERARSLQLVTKGQKASPFTYDNDYDEETSRYLWTTRITPPHEQTFSLMYGENSYATWKISEDTIRLVWQKEN